MAKKIKAKIKLEIPAGQATPAPPVGPALSQHGVNIKEFCDKFNLATKNKAGYVIPVKVIVYEDKTFDLQIKQPTTSDLIKKMAGIEKGSKQGSKEKVGKLTREQLREIAKIKLADLNTKDIEKAMKIIEGQAKNMGIEILP
jgi:large subunit ribosomal protein L11